MVDNCIASDVGSKIRSSSSSVSHISDLTDELLVEILCKFDSPKYATQCKCICKHWFSLIDTNPSFDSYFLRRWLHIHRKPEEELPLALLTRHLTGDYLHPKISHSFERPHLSLDFKYPTSFIPNHQLSIRATCKDLALCSDFCDNFYYICNPFTKQWIALPPPTFRSNNLLSRLGLLVSDGDDNGYGFIFKAVRATFSIPANLYFSHKMYVDIFSSDDSTREWREMVVPEECRPVDYPFCNSCWSLISYNGMMVWLGSVENVVGLRIDPHTNTAEDYIHISLPLGYNAWERGSLLGVCRGRLRIAQLDRTADTNGHDITYGLKLIIWELDNNGMFWELVHELDFSEIEDSEDSSLVRWSYRNENVRFDSSIVAFHPHDEDLLYLYFVSPLRITDPTVHSHFFVCNVRKKTLKVFGELPIWYYCNVLPLLLPSWPTPVPRLFSSTGS